jgi:hypothetical protein
MQDIVKNQENETLQRREWEKETAKKQERSVQSHTFAEEDLNPPRKKFGTSDQADAQAALERKPRVQIAIEAGASPKYTQG